MGKSEKKKKEKIIYKKIELKFFKFYVKSYEL